MEKSIEQLTDNIKQQAEVFLLDAGEFYPFGGCIDINGRVKPIGAYIEDENDQPSPLELINMIETKLKEGVANREYQLGALAIDVTLKEEGQAHDAVEVRIFSKEDVIRKKYLKYKIKEGYVEFS